MGRDLKPTKVLQKLTFLHEFENRTKDLRSKDQYAIH